MDSTSSPGTSKVSAYCPICASPSHRDRSASGCACHPQPITRRDDSTKMADTTLLVTGGVDAHKDFHVCVAVDELGRVLGTERFPTALRG